MQAKVRTLVLLRLLPRRLQHHQVITNQEQELSLLADVAEVSARSCRGILPKRKPHPSLRNEYQIDPPAENLSHIALEVD